MTTWENTDSLDNVTVTSDEAFERVTSDIKMEEETEWGFLKQNTSWLVQEIPNISFLDISDTMLESKKTFHNRKNWIIRVGNAGKSVEAQPQDTITLKLSSNILYDTFPAAIHFDDSISSLNNTVCKIDEDDEWKINILETWYYRISYWWTIDPGNNTAFSIWVWWSNSYITADEFDWWSYWTMMSWWRSISNVYLEQWDFVFMDVIASDDITVFQDFTYLEIQFQQYKL